MIYFRKGKTLEDTKMIKGIEDVERRNRLIVNISKLFELVYEGLNRVDDMVVAFDEEEIGLTVLMGVHDRPISEYLSEKVSSQLDFSLEMISDLSGCAERLGVSINFDEVGEEVGIEILQQVREIAIEEFNLDVVDWEEDLDGSGGNGVDLVLSQYLWSRESEGPEAVALMCAIEEDGVSVNIGDWNISLNRER